MKQLKVKLTGVTPLLMHDCKCVNPLHPITREMAKINAKGAKKKTDDDYAALSDLEFKASLYWDDSIGVYMPMTNVEACFVKAAAYYRNGTNFKKYVQAIESKVPLEYGENLTVDGLLADYKYRDVRQVKIQQNRIVRTRPRFDRWSCEFTLMYDDTMIDLEDIVNAIEYAGKFTGLGDYRPRYGQFLASIKEQ